MFTICFNHYVFDDPYKQSAVTEGFRDLEKFVREELNDYTFINVEKKLRNSPSFFGTDLSDEIVTVYHTTALTNDQKQTVVDFVQKIVSLKRNIYKKELPRLCVLFERKSNDDCFVIEQSK